MAEPTYRQIAADLERRIETSELEPGAQIPTETDLQAEYGASRNTVRDAIRRLTIRGLVEARPGKGMFVAEKITPVVTTLSVDREKGSGGSESDIYFSVVVAWHGRPRFTEPPVRIQEPEQEIAGRLRIVEGASIVSRHQQRFIDDSPWSLQTTFFLMTLVERGAKQSFDSAKLDAVLRNIFGITSSHQYDEATQDQRLAFLSALIRIRSQQKHRVEACSSLPSLQYDPLSRQTSTRYRMTASSHSVRGPNFPAAFWLTRGTAIAA